jgi:hypothetical protein
MVLLREIQNAAASTDSPVGDLLRKCKILAVRLKSDALGQWVDRELNGYTNKEELPAYRKLTHLHSHGNFDRGFGTILSNAPISPLLLPKQYQELVKNEFLGDGAPIYEDLITQN